MNHTTDTYFVALNGNDRWSGTLPEPHRARTDGPFKTAARAHRAAQSGSRDVQVIFRDGVHALEEPLVFLPTAAGKAKKGEPTGRNIGYQAFVGEHPVLSGGRRITGWRVVKQNGRSVWQVVLPEVKAGEWEFTQLWVNGRRAERPRLPRKGFFHTLPHDFAHPGDCTKDDWKSPRKPYRCACAKGDVADWKNLTDVEFVALHYWIESRIPLVKTDPRTGTIVLARQPVKALVGHGNEGASYFMDNVWEAFDAPGQWYLDRPTGILSYLPLKNETPATAEVYAPVLKDLVRLAGDAKRERYVRNVTFDGLTFSHTELGSRGADFIQPSVQAGFHLPGAITMRYARECAVTNCRIAQVGSYGIELLDQCMDVQIRHNVLEDLAGGGIKAWHTTRRTTIEDNIIRDGGLRHNQAVGVLIGKSSGNKVRHNHIHDFDYSGISVGWTWGAEEGNAYGNLIEYNHIHDVGRGRLSDLGGIYTLGVSPGTRIRHNVIHDVRHAPNGYGATGIYLDEGSSDILIENNLVYNVSNGYWCDRRDDIFRNNIVANCVTFSGRCGCLLNNIFYSEKGGLSGDWLGENTLLIDRNIYFNPAPDGKPFAFSARSFADWRRLGFDRHSRTVDPLFVDAARHDFRLRPNSPALAMGFIPFDVTRVGPRQPAEIFRPACESASAFARNLQVSELLPAVGDAARWPYPSDLKALHFKPRAFNGYFCSMRSELLAAAPADVIVYFRWDFMCAAALRLNVCVGYDGPVKVWVDGKARFADPQGTNPAAVWDAVIPVKVGPGAHHILVGLNSNHGLAHGIYLRLTWPGTGPAAQAAVRMLESPITPGPITPKIPAVGLDPAAEAALRMLETNGG